MGLFDKLRNLHNEANAEGQKELDQLRAQKTGNEAIAMAAKQDVLTQGATPEGIVPPEVAREANAVANTVRNTGEIPVIPAAGSPAEGAAAEGSPVAVMDPPAEQPAQPPVDQNPSAN